MKNSFFIPFYNIQSSINEYFVTSNELSKTFEVDSFFDFPNQKDVLDERMFTTFHIFGSYFRCDNFAPVFEKKYLGKLINELIDKCLYDFDNAMYYESDKFAFAFLNKFKKEAIVSVNSLSCVIYSPKYGCPFDFIVYEDQKDICIEIKLYVANKTESF